MAVRPVTSLAWPSGKRHATYTLDAVGIRTQRVDQLGTHTYAYDALYRLTSVTYPTATTSYTYDPVGNRLTMVDGAGTTNYAYDNADQLTSVTPPGQPAVNYTYGNNGNLTGRGSDAFVWDGENRLTSATVGGATTAMPYNGDGLRDSRTAGGNTATFTWDIAQGIPQILDDGSLKYVYGIGRVSQIGPGGAFYYLSDGLGSTMALTDAAGNVVNTYNYDVFGAIRSQTGTQPNEFQFAGEQVDGTTGFQYLRARHYDMATGRFLSQDPLWGWLTAPQSQNRYPYVLNNPVNYVDPMGLHCKWRHPHHCIKEGAEKVGGGIKRGAEAIGEVTREKAPQLIAGGALIVSGGALIVL